MRYQLYIDSYFFLSFMMNGFILFLMEELSECRHRLKWWVFGTVCGTVSAGLFIFLPGMPAVIKSIAGQFCAGIVMTGFVVRGFEKEQKKSESEGRLKKRFWTVFIHFWISTFLTGGILISWQNLFFLLTGRPVGMIGRLISGGIAVWGIGKGIRVYRRHKKQLIFFVELRQQEHYEVVYGLLDSGNSLIEPVSGIPVCLLDGEIMEHFLPHDYRDAHPEKFRIVPFHSVGKKNGLLDGFLVEEVIVHRPEGKLCRRDVVLAKAPEQVSMEGRYQMILNRCFSS